MLKARSQGTAFGDELGRRERLPTVRRRTSFATSGTWVNIPTKPVNHFIRLSRCSRGGWAGREAFQSVSVYDREHERNDQGSCRSGTRRHPWNLLAGGGAHR